MKQTITTDKAPAALGPYSQAVKTAGGTTIYISGQLGIDPATMKFVGDTVAEQCQQVMTNMGAILTAAGADFSKVVKTTIYLADMADFAAVNEVYGKFFEDNPPARATIEVAELPLSGLVEIDAVAVV